MPAPPRSWRSALGSLFADYEPVSSASAGTTVLDAVERGDWRVLIGDDAAAVEKRVRADPWTAYYQLAARGDAAGVREKCGR
jgi:hypothetical protein